MLLWAHLLYGLALKGVIQVTTAQKVKIIGGTAAVSLTTGAGIMAFANGAGGGVTQVLGFLKGAGLVSLGLGIIFIVVKAGIIKLVMLEEGEVALILRRGKVVYVKKTNLPKVLVPGGYVLHISLFRHIAVISTRERVIELGTHPVTVGGETWATRFALVWFVLGDPKSLHLALTRVHDTDKFDGKFGGLTDMLQEEAIGRLASIFKSAHLDPEDGIPIVDFEASRVDFEAQHKEYGTGFGKILHAPFYRYDPQHTKDGSIEIAASNRAIAEAIARLAPPVA